MLLLLPLLLVSVVVVVVVVELLLMRKDTLRLFDDAGMVNADAVNDDDVTPTLVSVAKDDNNAHPTIVVAENVGTLVMLSFQS